MIEFSNAALLMDILDTLEKRERRLVHLPMGRFGEAVEVARAALFCMSHLYAPWQGTDEFAFLVASDESSYVNVRFLTVLPAI
jgi:NAD(P)-dependent dehydrogenase (short-subunit alcohol dehydrogenase family)